MYVYIYVCIIMYVCLLDTQLGLIGCVIKPENNKRCGQLCIAITSISHPCESSDT